MIRPRDLGDSPHEWFELQQELMQWTPDQWLEYTSLVEGVRKHGGEFSLKDHPGLRAGEDGVRYLERIHRQNEIHLKRLKDNYEQPRLFY